MADKEIFGNSGPTNPDLPFSTFDKSFTNNMSATFATVYPCFVDLLPPHSTLHLTPHMAFDMMPMANPTQTKIRQHISFYKIPVRILQRSYPDIFANIGNHKIAYIKRSEDWTHTGSLADYMGLPSMTYRENVTASRVNAFFKGYADPRFSIGNEGLVGLPYDALFSESPIATQASSRSDIVWQFLIEHKLGTGLITMPFYSLEEVSPSAFGTRQLYLRAFRLSKSHSGRRVSAIGSSFTLKPGDWEIVAEVNGGITRDTSPSQGSVYPYSDLEPGRYSIGRYGETVTVQGVTINLLKFLFRLSDNFLTALNQLVADATNGQIVVLTLSYPSADGSVFGSQNYLPGINYDLSVLGTTVEFDNPISTGIEPEQGKPQQLSQLVSQLNLDLPFYGINGHGCWVDYAFVVNDPSQLSPFSSRDGADPLIPINAWYFRAYEFIHNYFFRNERVDPFYKLDPETGEMQATYNQFITNDGDGADSTTPVEFFQAPYEYDHFTTCMKTPQFGDAPLVGITTNENDMTATMLMRGQRVLPDGSTEPYDYTIAVQLDSRGDKILGIDNYADLADKPSVMRLNEAIAYGISINDFRNVNAFQIMKERFLKAGYLYKDLVKEFFGVTPPVGEEFPEYLGGMTRNVQISKIQNVALSEHAALGEFAGTGQVSGHGERIECFTAEWCIVMGVTWFSATPVYTQKLDKMFTYLHYLDFYNPALMHIGPQPVHKFELAPLQLPRLEDGSLDPAHLMDVFGYNRPWSEMVSREDESHGEFRSTMYNYILQRLFQECPSLGHKFLTMSSEDLTDIFTYTLDTDKFYGAILFEYYLKMPMPKVSIPRII